MCRVAGGEVPRAVQRAAPQVPGEGQRGMGAWQSGGGGGQDQTLPVAGAAAAVLAWQWEILQPPAPYYSRVIHGVIKRCHSAPGREFPPNRLPTLYLSRL